MGTWRCQKNLSEGGWSSQNPQVNWNLPFGSDAQTWQHCPTSSWKGYTPRPGEHCLPSCLLGQQENIKDYCHWGDNPRGTGVRHQVCLPMANGRITFLSPIFWKEWVATQHMHKLARLTLIYLDILLPLLISSSLKLLVLCLLVFFVLKQDARKSNQNNV